ncbi:HAD hydrolase-like protein [Pseudonocardia sp. GCM10023141]|uniref:HAD hydrolase-like protein n=1 Tax=Pseudonocardia sp. GCM10023141 TaxID=3252653 RepID=UPI003605BF90
MRTALLDLDGTLVDSAALITEHLAKALATVGTIVPTPEQLRALVGPPFETALPELGLTLLQTEAAIMAYRESYDPVAATETPLFPGTATLLQRLTRSGIRLAVATSKPEYLARSITTGTGIHEHFVLVGGTDIAAGRRGKAAVVGSVLERLGLDPTRDPVVMVGDRHHDVDGAAEHGVPTVGVGWGYAEPGELSGARIVVPDVDELAAALEADGVWSTADHVG